MAGMHRFRASTSNSAVVRADRAQIWDALTDPDLLPRLTPFLESVVVKDEQHWCWQLQRIPVLGTSLVPAFTERMELTPRERITFTHEPPPGSHERAGADGSYDLADHPDGTALAIELAVHVDLPLSRLAAPAVTTAMKGVMATMGARFAHNLVRHVGAS